MPSGVLTLGALRLASQRKADMENSQFLSLEEWNQNINLSAEELYDLLIQKYGSAYFEAVPINITTDGTNYLYALPVDFYKLLGVDLFTGGNPASYFPLSRFNLGERGQNYYQGAVPTSGQVIRVLYAPRFVELVSDSDTFDGISGWGEYVIVDSALKALEKEESDTSALQLRKDRLIQRIESAAGNRDAGNPATVRDVYAQRRGFGSSAGAQSLRYRLSGNNLWLEATPGGFGG